MCALLCNVALLNQGGRHYKIVYIEVTLVQPETLTTVGLEQQSNTTPKNHPSFLVWAASVTTSWNQQYIHRSLDPTLAIRHHAFLLAIECCIAGVS